MMSTKPRRKESKFTKCVKAPIRVLSRVRDLYVRSLSNCAGNMGAYGGSSVMGCPAPYLTTLPRSFSASSSQSAVLDDDLRELIRAASTRSQQQQQEAKSWSPVAEINVVPRSRTVAIGRIDEDKAYEFEEDTKLKTDSFPGSRSRSRSRSLSCHEKKGLMEGEGRRAMNAGFSPLRTWNVPLN